MEPTDQSERVTVASTAAGSHKTARAIEESAAVLGYESTHTRPPDGLVVGFVDYPFRDPTATFEEHLATVEAEQPAIAVAPDLDATRTPETVYRQADRLAEHAGAVVVTTKREDTHPADVPDRFRVGVPLQGDDGGEQSTLAGAVAGGEGGFAGRTPWRLADYRDAGPVHLLGGSPNVHREAAQYLDVASVDTSTPERVAKYGDYWTPDGWESAGEGADLYDTIRASLDYMVAWWADRMGYPSPVEPEPPRIITEGVTEQEPSVADPTDAIGYGAPPEPTEDTAGLWGEDDYLDSAVPGISLEGAADAGLVDTEMAAERRREQEKREQTAIERIRRESDPIATDGGKEVTTEMPDKNDIYDPTDEYDEIEEGSEILGIGAGRRKKLDALDAKEPLDDPQSFSSLTELTNALREISLAEPDGTTYMGVPEDAINAIEAAYNDLPDDAQREYLNDHRLYVKVRAARNRFNDWMGKKKREQKIPSSMEAGPSNYPSKKAKKTSKYAREGHEELKEALGKVKSAARGAKQRALEATGSSVAEQNEQKAQQKRDQRREEFEKGDLAFWSDTVYGNALWGVKRVNKKSVRLRRPHNSAGMEKPMSDGETYPEYDETRADLDSDRLEGPLPAEEVAKFDADDAGVRAPEDYIPERVDTAKEAQIAVFGEEWAEDNLALEAGAGTADAGSEYEETLDATTILSKREERKAAFDHVFAGKTMEAVGENLDVSSTTVGNVVQAYKSGGAALEKEILDEFGTIDDGGEEATNMSTDTNTSSDASSTDTEWAEAVEYLRENYGEAYQDRIDFSSDIAKFADENGVPRSKHFGDEGVTQPLIRFQDVPPADAYNQIENRAGEAEAKDIREALVAFAEAGAARGDDGGDGPQSPVTSDGATAAKLVVGRMDYQLPEAWDGWQDVAVRSQNADMSDGRGDLVAYISPSREEALVFEGTVVSNKWSLSAWRYVDPLPEHPTAEDLRYGSGGIDGPDERVKLTHGNTPTAEGWAANSEHYLTVEEVREKVPEPTEGDGGDVYDPTEEFTVEKQGSLDANVEPTEVAEEKQVSLFGNDPGEDTPIPEAWRESGTGSGKTWEAGPLKVSIAGHPDGPQGVELTGEDESHTIAEGIERKELAVEVAEKFVTEVAPPDVSFHNSENGAVLDAKAEAKQAIHQANHGDGLGAFTDDGGDDRGDEYDVRSPMRPLPHSARKELKKYDILRDLDGTDEMGRGDGVVVGEKPPRDLLDEYELVVDEDPLEKWENAGSFVDIYDDRVIGEAGEMTMEPEEAAREARSQGFTRLDDGGDPLGVEADDDVPQGFNGWAQADADEDDADENDYEGVLTGEEGGRVTAHAEAGRFDVALSSGGLMANQVGAVLDHFDTMDDLASYDGDLDDVKGIGPKTSDRLAGIKQRIEDADTPTPEADDGGGYEVGATVDDDYQGDYKNKHMENAHYWAAQLAGWMKNGPNAGLRGSYYVDVLAGKPVLVMDGEKFDHKSNRDAIKNGLRDAGFPSPLRVKETTGGEEYRLWVSEPSDDRLKVGYHPNWQEFETTGGDGGDPDAMFAADQLEWDTPNPNTDDGDDGPEWRPAHIAERVKKEQEGFVQEMMHDLEGTGLSPFDIRNTPGKKGEDYTTMENGEFIHNDDEDWADRRKEEKDLLAKALEAQPDTDEGGMGATTDERPYTIEVIPKVMRKGNEFLAVLRRNMADRDDLRDKGIYREDISEVIARFNHAKDEAGKWASVALSEDEMDILWAATSYYATEHGNVSELKRLESAMTDADIANDEGGEEDAGEEPETADDQPGTSSEESNSDESAASEVGRGTPVEFNRLDDANEWRDELSDADLHPDDTRRTKTLKLHPEASAETVEDTEQAATVTFADERKKYGQETLTDEERKTLENREGWSWGSNGFEAMSAKAALVEEGAADWLNYYEKGEGVPGSLANLEDGKEATAETGAGNAIRKDYVDSTPTRAEQATATEKAQGEACNHAEEGCESGYQEACKELRNECGYSDEEVEQLKAGIESMGEDPEEVLGGSIYDPTEDTDGDAETGLAFEEWAADAEPDAPTPTEEELATLAPERPSADDYRPDVLERSGIDVGDEFEPLPTAARRVIGSAWQGYRLSRVEATEGIEKAENYAETINGVRMANGLRPMNFDELEGLAESAHVPEDPASEYPTENGEKRSLLDAMKQGALKVTGGDIYDPTEDL